MNYSYRALAHAHSIKRSITNQNIEIGANVHMCVERKKQSNGSIEPSNSCIQKRFLRAIQYVFYGCSFWLLSPHVLNIYINCCLNSTPTPVQTMRCGAIVRISYYRNEQITMARHIIKSYRWMLTENKVNSKHGHQRNIVMYNRKIGV